MICVKTIATKPVGRTVNVLVSRRLYAEIVKMQELLMQMQKRKSLKKIKHINKIRVSDFLADVCRDARYKLQNGR